MASVTWFLDDRPSARFPVYCRGNVGEIVPNVATPFSASLTTELFRSAFTALFGETGAFATDELAEPAATGGVFGGYLYLNVALARAFAARAPGMRVADVDQQLFGSNADVPPFRRGPRDRNPLIKARAGVGVVRAIVGRDAPDLDAQRTETEAWARQLPREPSDDELVQIVASIPARSTVHLRSLLEASLGSGLPVSMLERVTKRAEVAEPGLLVRALSGLGTIETAGPAIDLWHLGRRVAASRDLTALFDDGVAGLLTRLEALSRSGDARAFLSSFEKFLMAHGHRGPDEIELASDTWSTKPAGALAAIDRLRLAPSDADPAAASVRLAREREAARARLRARVLPPLRPIVDRLLEAAASGAANREQAKGTLVRGLSAVRPHLFSAADRLVTDGQLPDRRQFFMATIDELPTLLRDPAALASALVKRRAAYEYLNVRVPPFSFEGRISDPATWPLRSRPAAAAARTTFTGIGVSAGKARGKARIITDPADPRGISPGEVLVAPLTDPAWTPLFLAAVAVVVDVGALQSHAAIVARELGVPAVVSVEGASSTIRDGDELEVDGDRGIVRLIR